MGNAASSGCFPSKKRAAAEAAAAEAEEPAAEELSDLEEEEVQPEQAAPSTAIESSPAPPLVMVDIKEKNQLSASSQVKNEWYEFGVDEKVCGECPPRQIRNTKKKLLLGWMQRRKDLTIRLVPAPASTLPALLRKAEMEHYIPNFAFLQIEFDTLPCLTVDGKLFRALLGPSSSFFVCFLKLAGTDGARTPTADLKDMNVNRVGHRRKLLSQFKGIEAA